MEKATVYFSRTITPEQVLELYKMAGKELKGNIAIKLHSGEKGNQNFLNGLETGFISYMELLKTSELYYQKEFADYDIKQS